MMPEHRTFLKDGEAECPMNHCWHDITSRREPKKVLEICCHCGTMCSIERSGAAAIEVKHGKFCPATKEE